MPLHRYPWKNGQLAHEGLSADPAGLRGQLRGLTSLVFVGEDQTSEFWLWSEIEQQSHLKIRSSQVVDHLLRVRAHQTINSFQLYQYTAVDYEVSTKESDPTPVVSDLNGSLSFDVRAKINQFECERFTIDGFDKTRSQLSINAIESTKYSTRVLPMKQTIDIPISIRALSD